MFNTLSKWLIIVLVSLLVLMMILLGLGYLLKENERETRALKAQLDQERKAEQAMAKKPLPLVLEQTPEQSLQAQYKRQLEKDLAELEYRQQDVTQIKQIIIENLVCQEVSQCRLVDTASIDLGCVIATNTIGQSMLKAFDFKVRDQACEERISDLSLTCHHNICSIK